MNKASTEESKMPRELLIGMTLMLTLAVLGAGGEAPTAPEMSAQSTAAEQPARVAAQPVDTDRAHSTMTFYSPVGTLQLVGVTDKNSVSFNVSFDETI